VVSDKEYQGAMGTQQETMVCELSYFDGFTEEQVKANTELIAEAGNVANETGLSPRQLLEQRNELLNLAKFTFKGLMGHLKGVLTDEAHEGVSKVIDEAIKTCDPITKV